jgi:hypothetical protein
MEIADTCQAGNISKIAKTTVKRSENIPSCARDYSILVVESSHAKAVDGVDLATAGAARAAGGVVTHLDLESGFYFSKGTLRTKISSCFKALPP